MVFIKGKYKITGCQSRVGSPKLAEISDQSQSSGISGSFISPELKKATSHE
jgi:hypothetical protein